MTRVPNIKGALGPKPEKQPKQPRKPLPKQSAKRKRYMASDARKQGLEHMGRVAQLPCLVCGKWPVEVHHLTKPRNDMEVIPLCPRHHRREFGPGSYHYSPQAFIAAHGSVEKLLARVREMLLTRHE